MNRRDDYYGFIMALSSNINFTQITIEMFVFLAHAQAVREVQVDGSRGFQDP